MKVIDLLFVGMYKLFKLTSLKDIAEYVTCMAFAVIIALHGVALLSELGVPSQYLQHRLILTAVWLLLVFVIYGYFKKRRERIEMAAADLENYPEKKKLSYGVAVFLIVETLVLPIIRASQR